MKLSRPDLCGFVPPLKKTFPAVGVFQRSDSLLGKGFWLNSQGKGGKNPELLEKLVAMSDTGPSLQAESEKATEIVPRARRARVYKKGKMVFQNGLRSIPCIVRNISQGGALLEFEQAYMLPKHFELYIDLEDYEVSCERRWEEGLRCGVMFVGEKRQVAQMRAQSLKTSEEALTKDDDPYVDNTGGFFDRRKADDRRPVKPGEPLSRPRPGSASGKPSFGKRR